METRELIQFGLDATYTRVLRCVEDISEKEARERPQGLAPLVWQVGHLALADAGFLRRAGLTQEVPTSYLDLFKTGSGGLADYPSVAEVRSVFEAGQRALTDLLRSVDLSRPIESRNYSTVGEMLVFACYHRGYHIGKMTTLRALLSKPRLFG